MPIVCRGRNEQHRIAQHRSWGQPLQTDLLGGLERHRRDPHLVAELDQLLEPRTRCGNPQPGDIDEGVGLIWKRSVAIEPLGDDVVDRLC